jgi:transketolase
MNPPQKNSELIKFLKEKALWVRKETLKIHRIAPAIRLASSLSDVEIFVSLYYGKILKTNPKNFKWEVRDRFIISKPHGAISLYPILADLGFFDKRELTKVCQEGSFLGSIPDTMIPGFETVNGALGHGLGVACGVALALKKKNSSSKVFVLSGDGELNEGAVWEAVMFAFQHRLSNLILIIDNNKISMLDYCRNIIDLTPLQKKFQTFKWKVKIVDGHNIEKVFNSLKTLKGEKNDYPKVLIANTIKGKGVLQLENDPLCHIKSLREDEIIKILKDYNEF